MHSSCEINTRAATSMPQIDSFADVDVHKTGSRANASIDCRSEVLSVCSAPNRSKSSARYAELEDFVTTGRPRCAIQANPTCAALDQLYLLARAAPIGKLALVLSNLPPANGEYAIG